MPYIFTFPSNYRSMVVSLNILWFSFTVNRTDNFSYNWQAITPFASTSVVCANVLNVVSNLSYYKRKVVWMVIMCKHNCEQSCLLCTRPYRRIRQSVCPFVGLYYKLLTETHHDIKISCWKTETLESPNGMSLKVTIFV